MSFDVRELAYSAQSIQVPVDHGCCSNLKWLIEDVEGIDAGIQLEAFSQPEVFRIAAPLKKARYGGSCKRRCSPTSLLQDH